MRDEVANVDLGVDQFTRAAALGGVAEVGVLAEVDAGVGEGVGGVCGCGEGEGVGVGGGGEGEEGK